MLRVFGFYLLVTMVLPVVAQAGDGTSANKIAILASIKPIQLIVKAIVGDEQPVEVLVPPGMSLHDYALRPSDYKKIQKADMLVWLGSRWEPYLAKAVSAEHGTNAANVSDLSTIAIQQLDNPHIWLSLIHAKKIAIEIKDKLVELNPSKKELYQNNLAVFLKKLELLNLALRKDFAQGGNYLVYHDAYSYLEAEYGLKHEAIISEHHEVKPGARHLLRLRKTVSSKKVRCIIVEPESNLDIVKVVSEGFDVHTKLLDPMATDVKPNIDGYISFVKALGSKLSGCRGELSGK